ncbi:MAG: hypothetical protein IJV87_04850 [Clostridia bacterium]|nr:hypothetical protein [Clostridia bacterium]
MKRKIVLVALVICALLLCSCDFLSFESQQNELITTTDSDSGIVNEPEATVETEDETKSTNTAETTDKTKVDTTKETEVETADETKVETTDETEVETTDETEDETTVEAELTTEQKSETEVESEVETEAGSELADLAYGKTTISGDLLYVYELLEDHVLADQPAEEIKIDESKSITIDEFSDAASIFFSDHPECFWWLGGGNYSVLQDAIKVFYPEYLFEIDDIAAKRAELDAVVDEVLKGVPEGSTFDKALYLHDKVAETVIYKYGTHDQTPYGALVLGEAVCNGYSTAYQLLLMRSGIRAWTVNGYSKDEPHAWTVVWLDDETCVYTDVTWDDQDDHGVILRNYFNMSLDEIDDDHFVNELFVLPECNHDDQGYYEVIGAVINDSDGVEKIIGLFSAGENGEHTATFCYKGADFNAWFNNNSNDIFAALGAKSLSYSMYGNEVTVTATK